MILTTHALVGAALGKNIENIWEIILISFIFHFLLDILRHGEYLETINKKSTFRNTFWKIALDLIAGFLIIFAAIFWENFSLQKASHIFLGAFFSIFPDFLTFLYWQFKWKFLAKLFHLHKRVHALLSYSAQDKLWTWRNSLNDLAISTIAIILLFI